jgi:hypothetical protein
MPKIRLEQLLGLAVILGLSTTSTLSFARSNSAITSHNGREIATINQVCEADEDNPAGATGCQVLVVQNSATGVRRNLFVSRFHPDFRRNTSNLVDPMYSLDGGYVYVTATASRSPYRTSIQQVSVSTGAARFVG